MKINDIITLTQAGWTKDEIMSIMNEQPAQPEQQAQPDPQPAQPDPQPAQPEQQSAQPAQPFEDRFKALETKLDYVVNRFNYIAVSQSTQPEQHTETVDDILSSLVRGTKQE